MLVLEGLRVASPFAPLGAALRHPSSHALGGRSPRIGCRCVRVLLPRRMASPAASGARRGGASCHRPNRRLRAAGVRVRLRAPTHRLRRGRHRGRPRGNRGRRRRRAPGRARRPRHPVPARLRRRDVLQPFDRRARQGSVGPRDRRAGRDHGRRRGRVGDPVPGPQRVQGPRRPRPARADGQDDVQTKRPNDALRHPGRRDRRRRGVRPHRAGPPGIEPGTSRFLFPRSYPTRHRGVDQSRGPKHSAVRAPGGRANVLRRGGGDGGWAKDSSKSRGGRHGDFSEGRVTRRGYAHTRGAHAHRDHAESRRHRGARGARAGGQAVRIGVSDGQAQDGYAAATRRRVDRLRGARGAAGR